MKLHFYRGTFGGWTWKPHFYRDESYFELSWGLWIFAVWPPYKETECTEKVSNDR